MRNYRNVLWRFGKTFIFIKLCQIYWMTDIANISKKVLILKRNFLVVRKKRPDRQERCTNAATGYFCERAGCGPCRQSFPNFDETKINEVGSRIRQSIQDGLAANTWLSKEGKKEALAKIKNARLQLVKPHTDKEWDFMPLRKYTKDKYIENMITYNGARWDKVLQEVREPANMDAWGMGPLTVNAYYSPNENKFVLPIRILQYPFYDKDGSVIENLGAVGAVDWT